tara:strand:- start:581 stop:844 length:264 start_codon:yes stop_codon:yes gene_type:complete
MDISDRDLLDLYNRSSKIIDSYLENLSRENFDNLKEEINNLPKKIKLENSKIMSRISFIKSKYESKKIENITPYSSGDLDFIKYFKK